MKHRTKKGIHIYSRTGEYGYINWAKYLLEYLYEIGQIHCVNHLYIDDKHGDIYIILTPDTKKEVLENIVDEDFWDYANHVEFVEFENDFGFLGEVGRVVVFVNNRKQPEKKVPKNITPKIRASIISRDKAKCTLCNNSGDLEIHHIIPVSLIKRLGLDEGLNIDESNLTTLCRDCNIGLGDRLNLEIINTYIDKFGYEDHPNNSICDMLLRIKALHGRWD